MTDEPIILPAFLPKDREGSIRMIAEVLYGRLELIELYRKIADREGYPDFVRVFDNEINFLRNLLNLMECS